ncbi:hypothetical protein FA13DRAFT_1729158 [Coprinellus micaceus]|uniref:Chaperone DnaJ C-terminal domain-containing protein n=1 Tax=Coprinellus micaceus TaxID=71717 RepID=A0A4Y7TK14_COPMI|nr:hypothetical protein FA13DRAFT_1729158 [Coprinellus micaceus]
MQPALPGCHRFRDASVLVFSPFNSLAEFKSAVAQLSPAGSLRPDFTFSSPANKTRPSACASHPRRRDTPHRKHYRMDSASVQTSVDSLSSISSQEEFHFEPLATSTEYRHSHKTQASHSKLPPWSETSPHWEEGSEESPPPYSCRKSFDPNVVSPSYEANWDYRELNEYSQLDLENETLSSRYTQCVDLPLEDYYHGKQITYGFTRKYNSGKKRPSCEMLTVVVPPGCQTDTVFCFSNVGHQLEDGTFQDIHLIFVERPHPLRFRRSGADLSARVRLPWSDLLKESPMRFSITGVDGKKYSLEVDYQANKMVAGSAIFQGAGMPCGIGRGERGTLRIEWEIATFVSGEVSP